MLEESDKEQMHEMFEKQVQGLVLATRKQIEQSTPEAQAVQLDD